MAYRWLSAKNIDVSDDGYQILLALDSTCARQQSDRLAQIERMIEAHSAFSQAESNGLQEIINEAKSGGWTEARQMTRDLMRSQIRSAP